MNQLVKEIIGNDITPVQYAAGFIFCILGSFIRISWRVYGGVKDSENKTPVKFNIKYFLKDNLRKINSIFVSIIIVFICFRLPNDLFGVAFSYGFAFIVGLGYDYIDDRFKKGELNLFKTIKGDNNGNS